MNSQPSTTEIKPQTVRRAVRAAGLPRVESAMLLAVLDRQSWDLPRLEGVSVTKLAADCGYSRRHGRRGLDSAAVRDLVKITVRDWAPNTYELQVEAILALAKARKGQGRLALASSAEDIDRPQALRRDAGLRRARPLPAGVASSADEQFDSADATSDAIPAHVFPDWVHRTAGRLKRSPEQIRAVVEGVIAAIWGERADAAHAGTVAKPILRLWRACDFAADLPEQVGRLVLALDERCEELPLLHARGLRLVARRASEVPRVEPWRGGIDLRYSPGLLAKSRWMERAQSARRHAQGRCSCRRHHRAEEAAAPIDAPAALRLLVGTGGAVEELTMQAARGRWQAAQAALREQLGAQNYDIWVRPLRLVEVEGAPVLEASQDLIAAWVAEHYGPALADVLGGQVRLRARGPPGQPES